MKLNSNLSLRQVAGARKIGENTKPSLEQPVSSMDSVHISAKPPTLGQRLKNGLRKALLTTAMFVSLAGPVAAQMPVGAAALLTEPTRIELVQQQPARAVTDTLPKAHVGVRAYFINDNMPTFMSGALGNPNTLVPNSTYADDDGWTTELRLETTVTRPASETFVGARLNIVTETGSWQTNNPNYQGRRTDVGEVVVQQNFRKELSGGQTLDYGVGGGVQAVGNVGGESVQRWWHSLGTFGGRTGDALQSNQVTEGFRLVPIGTAGINLTTAPSHGLSLKAGAQTTVPFGSGLGYAGVKAGVKGDFGPVNVELGGRVDAAWNMAPELSFHNPTGIRPGAYLQAEVQAGKVGGIFTRAEVGGVRQEPIFTVGLKVGLGNQARLNPFW